MTDKEKLDKLIAEIERRKKMNILNENKYEEDIDLLSFYNSMKEKPTRKCKGCNNVKGCITCVDGSEYAHIEECDITGIKSEEVIAKLEESVEDSELIKESQLDSPDFKAALEKKVREAQDWTYIKEEGGSCPLYEEFGADDLEEFAEWGASWMREQMMKEAVTAEVRMVEDFMGTTTFRCICDKYKIGDKVKLIIIKED